MDNERLTSHLGEHSFDTLQGKSPLSISGAVYVYSFCAAINSANIGYDIGVSTNIGPLVQDDFGLTDRQRELFAAALQFTAMFGALASQWFSDRFGRRTTFVVTSLMMVQGLLLMAWTNDYTILMIGRLLVGIGVGVGYSIDGLYIAEISPAQHRGELASWASVGVSLGCLTGFSTGLLFSELPVGLRWRAMCLVGALFPALMIVLTLILLPETPRWLVLNGLDDDATKVLKQIYPAGYDVILIIDDIKESAERELIAEKAVGWRVFLHPTPAVKRQLFLCVFTFMVAMLSGLEAIQYFLVEILEAAGVTSESSANKFLVVFGVVKVISAMIGTKLLDKTGRRFLLFLSMTGLTAALLLIALSFMIPKSPGSTNLALVSLLLFIYSDMIGIGLVAWLLPCEIFSTTIRAKGVSLSTFAACATTTMVISNFLSIQKALTWPGVFLFFASVNLIAIPILYFYLPETKNRSLESMSLYFAEVTGDYSILEAEKQLRLAAAKKKKDPQSDAA